MINISKHRTALQFSNKAYSQLILCEPKTGRARKDLCVDELVQQDVGRMWTGSRNVTDAKNWQSSHETRQKP